MIVIPFIPYGINWFWVSLSAREAWHKIIDNRYIVGRSYDFVDRWIKNLSLFFWTKDLIVAIEGGYYYFFRERWCLIYGWFREGIFPLVFRSFSSESCVRWGLDWFPGKSRCWIRLVNDFFHFKEFSVLSNNFKYTSHCVIFCFHTLIWNTLIRNTVTVESNLK